MKMKGVNRPLQKCEDEKDLGVIFDKDLSFDNHIQKCVNKANQMIGLIKKNKTFSYLNKDFISHNSVRNVRSRESESTRKSLLAWISSSEGVQWCNFFCHWISFTPMGFIIALFVCVGAHVFVLLFHKVALPVQVRKQFISVLFRIDWTPVNRPTWHRRLPAWQPEAIQAEKQALKAKSSKDSSVSDKLDILITSVSYLKEDYKEFKNRLALLEARVERIGSEFRWRQNTRRWIFTWEFWEWNRR